ncbi:MAG TPA: pitrilysin family protein [Gemmatimonadales bacterium]|nr:pitrilysin family protein [Gemmatimonadales bacterium]
MNRRILSLLLAGIPAALSAQGVPPTPPPAGAVVPAVFPPFQEATLPNGLRLVLVERHDQPVLSVTLSLSAGQILDPAGKDGLADMVAGLLTKGAGNHTANQVAEAIEGVGGSLNASAGQDWLSIQADGLSSHALLFFELLADAVIRPTFAAEELDLLRRQELTSLQAEQTQPDAIAERFFYKGIYGQHPYGRHPSPESVAKITREDLQAFHDARFRPSGALLVLAGDVTLADATKLATQAFGSWTGKPTVVPPAPAPPARLKTEILLVHRPSSVQSTILVGNTTFPAADTNYFAVAVANRVLGGGADSRLFRILREEKGWTYGAYSSVGRPRGIGTFESSTEVRTEVTDSALKEMLNQLRRMGAQPVPAAELDGAKGALVGSFPLTVQTANQVAGAVARVKLLGLPADYLKTYRTRLAAESPARVLAVSKAMIRPNASLIVVVGDGAAIYDKLKTIAPIKIVTPEGTPLTEAQLTAKTDLNLDLGQLADREDTLTVMANGKPVGRQITGLSKSEDGYQYRENTEIQNLVKQTTSVTFGADGGMRKLTQDGTIQGQAIKAALTYGPGRVQGFASLTTTKGPQTTVIDTIVTPEVLDENVLQGLLPAFRLKANASWTLRVFSATENRIRTETLKVAGVEKVALAGGEVEAFRAICSSDNQAVTYFVTTASPHRVIKVAIANTPLEFVSNK